MIDTLKCGYIGYIVMSFILFEAISFLGSEDFGFCKYVDTPCAAALE